MAGVLALCFASPATPPMNRRHFLALSAAVPAAVARGQSAAAAGAPGLVFGLLTDVQYADADASGERHYRASVPKLGAAVAGLAAAKPALVLHLGDFIDRDYGSFAALTPLLEPLGAPVHHLLGNHDYSVADADKARVPSTLGMPHDYYLLRLPGLRLLMTDTTDAAPYKHPAGSPRAAAARAALPPGAQPWGGGIGDAQLAWLERELAAATAAGDRAIVCGHHPLLPEDGHPLWNAAAVIELLVRHRCVIAWFNGHHHAGGEVVRDGVPFITFKSLLHHPDQTAWSLVRVTADTLAIAGHGREKSRAFPLRPAR
jgi:manganese-dependent ADP-ribose/CDP-alcohol diphosphatase